MTEIGLTSGASVCTTIRWLLFPLSVHRTGSALKLNLPNCIMGLHCGTFLKDAVEEEEIHFWVPPTAQILVNRRQAALYQMEIDGEPWVQADNVSITIHGASIRMKM